MWYQNTCDTVEMGTVLHRFGKLKPVPVPVHTHDTLSWVYLYPCHALDFQHLSMWLLYRKGTREIPVDSIVSVGYTIGTYRGAMGLVLSSNIHFVILLSVPH
jgi:hypothetical protein